MKKDELKRKSRNIKNLIKGVVKESVSVPDNALVFLDYNDLLEVFTKKRLELIKLIDKEKPKSLQELAKLTDRKKQAINRDLRILENQEVVKFEKKGRIVIPKLNKKMIMLPLTVELKRMVGGKRITIVPVGRSYGRVVANVRHKRRSVKR